MAAARAMIVCLTVLLASGCGGASVKQPQLTPQQQMFGSSSTLEAMIEGFDYKWTFSLPGPDGKLRTEDDLQTGTVLWLLPNQSVRLHFSSSDYVYTFLQSELGINEMAVPGLDAETTIKTPADGTFEISSAPLCGFLFAHADYRPILRIGIPDDLPNDISGTVVHETH